MNEIGLLIGGQNLSAGGVATFDRLNPLTNKTVTRAAAAVFSRDIPRALRVAKRLQTGMCHINGATVHDEAQMPFGGVKASGYGRFGGKAGISEFTELRWITIETRAGKYPI